jgi:hypothetical protein
VREPNRTIYTMPRRGMSAKISEVTKTIGFSEEAQCGPRLRETD